MRLTLARMTQFPDTLRTWRRARRFSQLDLALEAEVSARHISFLETGRARPSAEMIGRLGDALQMPLSARNQMLAHAGFAARYGERDWDMVEMAPIRQAVAHMLDTHMPFPALALDRVWTVVRMNPGARLLFAALGVGEGDSLLDLMMRPDMPDVIENWPEVAHHVVQRLRTESAAAGGVPELDHAAARLARVDLPAAMSAGPVIPTLYRAGGMRLALFATIAQFGTPEDLTLDNLKVELYFPADEDSAATLRGLADRISG